MSGMAKEMTEDIHTENMYTEITDVYLEHEIIKPNEINNKYRIDLKGGVGGRAGGRVGGARIGKTSGGKVPPKTVSPKTNSAPKSSEVSTDTKSTITKASIAKSPYPEWSYIPSPIMPSPTRFYADDDRYSSFFPFQTPRLFPNYFGNNYYYNNTKNTKNTRYTNK